MTNFFLTEIANEEKRMRNEMTASHNVRTANQEGS